jgi:hypothetical protein
MIHEMTTVEIAEYEMEYNAYLAATEVPHVCESCDGSGYKLIITRGDVWQWESEEIPCPECGETEEEVPF